jgi:hypothetical protein
MHTGSMGMGYSMEARGQFAYSGGFGRIKFAYNRFGFYHWLAGIYQKKYIWGKSYFSREQFYRPSNPQTLAQQNWRAVHAFAWTLWRLASSDTQKMLNKKGNLKHMTGPNLFFSHWLFIPTGSFGYELFGYAGFGSNYQFDKNF